MPSVTKQALADIEHRATWAERQAAELEDINSTLRARITAFDAILDKIAAAAQTRTSHSIADSYAMGRGGSTYAQSQDWRFDPVTGTPIEQSLDADAAQRAEFRETQLHERLSYAEGRLSAVLAMAQMAKVHKA